LAHQASDESRHPKTSVCRQSANTHAARVVQVGRSIVMRVFMFGGFAGMGGRWWNGGNDSGFGGSGKFEFGECVSPEAIWLSELRPKAIARDGGEPKNTHWIFEIKTIACQACPTPSFTVNCAKYCMSPRKRRKIYSLYRSRTS
jgi:hypothetical protein